MPCSLPFMQSLLNCTDSQFLLRLATIFELLLNVLFRSSLLSLLSRHPCKTCPEHTSTMPTPSLHLAVAARLTPTSPTSCLSPAS